MFAKINIKIIVNFTVKQGNFNNTKTDSNGQY